MILYVICLRGQVQGSNTLEHCVNVELIYEGFKYRVQVTKSGPNSYFLVMNGSFKEIELHRLSDGGNTYMFYLKRIFHFYYVLYIFRNCCLVKEE